MYRSASRAPNVDKDHRMGCAPPAVCLRHLPLQPTNVDQAGEAGIVAVQGPLDLVKLALLFLGKRHQSSPPGSRPQH